MASLSHRIRRARLSRGWGQDQLAEQMTLLRARTIQQSGEPMDDLGFSPQQVRRLESGRVSVALSDPDEPLWWALRALGIDKKAALEECP